jgi:hypothetical protein
VDEKLRYLIESVYSSVGFKQLQGDITKTEKGMGSLEKSSVSFFKLFAAGGASALVLSFLKDGLLEVEKNEDAWRRLGSAFKTAGLPISQNKDEIEKWADSMQSAKLEGDDAIDALGLAITRLRDLRQGMAAVKLAQDIAIARGDDFNMVLDMLTRAMGGSSRGLMQLKQEFGAMIIDAGSTSEAIKILYEAYNGQAEAAKSATLNQTALRLELKALKEEVGTGIAPSANAITNILTTITRFARELLIYMETFGAVLNTVVVSGIKSAWVAIEAAIKSLTNLLSGNFKKALSGDTEGMNNLTQSGKEFLKILREIDAKMKGDIKDLWKGGPSASGGVIPTAVSSGGGMASATFKAPSQAVFQTEPDASRFGSQLNIGMGDAVRSITEKMMGFSALYQTIMQQVVNLSQGASANAASSFRMFLDSTSERFLNFGDLVGGVFQGILDAFLDMIAQMLAKMSIFAIFNVASGGAFSKFTGGLGSFLGFADGGRPPVGMPSIVGERGPELFVPDSAGTIIPNGAFGGTSVTVAPVININGNPDASTIRQITEAIKRGTSEALEMSKAAYKVGRIRNAESAL